jgi:hypothetical protein
LIAGFATINRVQVPVTMVAQYQEKPSIILLSKVFAIYSVAMLLILIPIAGVYGAAIAHGSAQTLKNLFIWWHVRDMARWTNLRVVTMMSLVIWGPWVAVCLALKELVAVPPALHLAVGTILCGLGAVLYARSPVLSLSDREILASVFHGREARVLAWLGVTRTANAK